MLTPDEFKALAAIMSGMALGGLVAVWIIWAEKRRNRRG